MLTFIFILLALACLLGGLAWYKGRSFEAETDANYGAPNRRRDFRAIEIIPGDDCCEAARLHIDKRQLLEHAPRVPLSACDRINECRCRFRNHKDRRDGDGRRNPFGSLSQNGAIGMQSVNKRSGLDRRASIESELTQVDFD